MNILFSLFFYLIEFYVAFDVFSELFEERHKKSHTVLIGLTLYTVAFLVFIFVENFYVNLLVFFLVNFLYMFFAFECKNSTAVIFSLYLLVLLTATEVLVIKDFSAGLTGNYSVEENTTIYLITSVISKLLYFTGAKLALPFFFRRRKDNSSPLFLFLLSMASVMQLILLLFLSSNFKFPFFYEILFIVSAVISILAVIITFAFYSKTTDELSVLYQKKREADRVVTDLAYYEILNEQNEKLKAFMHDEKNHLLVIKSLADNEEVSSYIDSIYENIRFHSIFGNTKNKYLDLLINKYNSICKANSIDFEINIKTANLSFMQPPDLICIVSNILDNATTAAIASEGKTISFSINSLNGSIFLECINSCDTKPKVHGNVLETLKKDKDKHGNGIKSIKQTVKKYKGEFTWQWLEEEKLFKSRCVFAVKEDEK